ncbi:MAG: RadC family protein [Ruminococcus sp.]
MQEKKINLNAGHRERMRKRYLANGLNGFQPHEIIEFILFFSKPRCDTNKTAHELIRKFHSVAGVLDAEIEDLCRVNGVGTNSAILLHLLPDIFREYQLSRQNDKLCFKSRKELKAYLAGLYIGIVNEQTNVICFDSSAHVISIEPVGSGSTNAANVEIRTVAEIALRNRASSIALVHNHPDGDPTPSNTDVFSTNGLQKILRPLDIELTDHFIVGKTVLSMKELGYIN